MSPRTVFLSKLIGLYCLILAISMVLHKEFTTEVITALAQNSPVMFVVGVFTLFAGLAMVLGHNLWRGGALTIVVTLHRLAHLAQGRADPLRPAQRGLPLPPRTTPFRRPLLRPPGANGSARHLPDLRRLRRIV